MPPHVPIEARFWPRVQQGTSEECWPWTGPTYGGYGAVNTRLVQGLTNHAKPSRVAWFLEHGSVPEAPTVVLHSCEDVLCCNPAHMYLGLRQSPVLGLDPEGRRLPGRRQGNSKLTLADVAEVRAARAAGEPVKSIAARYPCTESNIYKILAGGSWV